MHTVKSGLTRVAAALAALLLAGCSTREAKPDMMVDGIASGAVAGTLSINGASTTLRYAYARRQLAGELEMKRLRVAKEQTLQQGVVYVLLANRPLSAQQIDSVIAGNYDGAKNLNAVLLIIDAAGTHHWEAVFVTDTQMFSIYGFTSTGGPDPKIENDRIVGMLALRNQDAVFQRSFLVYFDSALPAADAQWTTDIGQFGAVPCGSPAAFADFVKVLPGKWTIETWAGELKSNDGPVAKSYTGTLAVDERISTAQFHGTFHFVAGDDKPDIEEQAMLDCTNGKIIVRGAVIPETHWIPDALALELKGRRLVGGGTDAAGQTQQVVLRKN